MSTAEEKRSVRTRLSEAEEAINAQSRFLDEYDQCLRLLYQEIGLPYPGDRDRPREP